MGRKWNKNIEEKWKTIIMKQQKIMNTWKKSRPTFRGKELLLKALTTSKSWFLATINGMLKHIQKEMEKNMKDFLWDGRKKGLITMEAASTPREDGGLGIPSIEARLKAIQIMWLKKYLETKEKRPTWAWLADNLIAKDIAPNTTPKVDTLSKISWIKQTWRTKQGKHLKLPNELKDMLKIAEHYNIQISTRKTDQKLKENMIVWHQVMKPKENYSWNKLAAKCLRETHRVQTIGELNDFIKVNEIQLGNECTKQEACLKMAKRVIEMPSEKWDPNKGTPYKDNLDHMEKRKKQFQKYIEEKKNLYNPDITEKDKPEDAIRIFIKQKIMEETAKQKPVLRKHKGSGKKWVIYTDSSCKDGNTSKARARVGTYCETDDSKTKAIKIPGKTQTNQRGELIAILSAIESVPKGDKLKIISDSKYSIKGIIKGIPKWTDEGWINVENKDIF